MKTAQRQLRVHRIILAVGGSAYLCWWFFVRLALPSAFNPFGSRIAVVACFLATWGATYVWPAVARQVDAWLALCCSIATAHYFYLFDRNGADLNWVVGSYITVIAVCAVLQTARALLAYSLFVAAISLAMLVRQHVGYVVFLPGMLTSLVFANIGLNSRLRLLARLEESHERVASLFDAGFDAIAVHEKGVVRQVNDAVFPLLGYTKEEVVGREVLSFFPTEARERVAEMVASARERKPFEVDLLRKDGTRVPVEILAKRHVQNGREMQQVALRDLTERKRAEADLVRANRELESFSYSVAHDLRAPLRAINGYSKMLVEDYASQLDAEGRRYLERIAGAARTMGDLIDALLGLARLTRQALQRESVDLTAEVRAIAKQLQATQPDRSVELSVQSDVVAQGDPQLVRALLDNLLANAWKFTARRDPAHITFGATSNRGQSVYFVRDDGAGFDMEHVGKLFGPFQRLHTGTDFPGTGIGLATVHRIVERHGGRVWAEGAVNEGATFYFTLQPEQPN